MNADEQSKVDSCIELLVGKELAAITFVRDYVQFAFDGPVLSAFNLPDLWDDNKQWTSAVEGYRDRLCQMIGKKVSRTILSTDKIILFFDGGARLEITTLVSVGHAEAAMFNDPATSTWQVWN
jgi:hypothetical protein